MISVGVLSQFPWVLFSAKWFIHLKRNCLGALRSCSYLTIYNFQSYNSDYIYPFRVKSVSFPLKKKKLSKEILYRWLSRKTAGHLYKCLLYGILCSSREGAERHVCDIADLFMWTMAHSCSLIPTELTQIVILIS